MTVTPNSAQLSVMLGVLGMWVCGMCWQLQLQGKLGSTWMVTDCMHVHEVCDGDA